MGDIVEMNEDRQRWLEDRAKRMGFTKGRVGFSTCGLCGSAEWACTAEKGPSGEALEGLDVYEVINMPDSFQYRCGVCASVQMRAPEIFHWVMAAIEWSHNRPKETRS